MNELVNDITPGCGRSYTSRSCCSRYMGA